MRRQSLGMKYPDGSLTVASPLGVVVTGASGVSVMLLAVGDAAAKGVAVGGLAAVWN